MDWNSSMPTIMMPTAAQMEYLMVFFMRSPLRAPKLYATIGTVPLFRPNTGMNTKL